VAPYTKEVAVLSGRADFASIGFSERIRNNRLGTMLSQQVIQCLERKRLQGRVLVKGQLPQRS
jgi:hypothetical protein